MKKLFLILMLLPGLAGAQGTVKDIEAKIKEINCVPGTCRISINKLFFPEELLPPDTITLPLPPPCYCGDKPFWELVKLKDKAIPALIDKLDDTTITAAPVSHKSYNYTVADISYVILTEIISARAIPGSENNNVEAFRKHYKKRVRLKRQINKWYTKNKENMVWVSSNEFGSCDCKGPHPNGGHYIIEK